MVSGGTEARSLLLGLASGGVELIGSGSGPLAPGAANLASATSVAVLGASTITNTGSSVITGDLDLYPGTSVTGSPTVSGATNIANATAHLAQTDTLAAYTDLQGRTPTKPVNTTLSSATLTAGVYPYSSSASLTGTLTLNGSATDVFIFQIASTLTTASASSVVLTGGALPQNVFWAVGSSATLGTTTDFQGTIIAQASVTDNGGATVEGRLMALTGAVTLNNTTVTNSVSVATAGTSISAFPATSLTGGALLISVDGGSPQPIILGTDHTGAAIATDIQTQMRALFPSNPSYSGFTATYNNLTGLYTLSSGTTGLGSSVVVKKISDDVTLKLGVTSGGVENAGTISTAGTSVSAGTPATTTSVSDTLVLNLNGDGVRVITLGTNLTGAATAADIQAKVRALTAITGGNQSAYNNFTAVFSSGVYTLTSGTVGTGSTVVVSGTSNVFSLLLGPTYGGVELTGVAGTSQITFNTARYTGEIINFIKIGV